MEKNKKHMNHVFQTAIYIDDEKIVESIEKNAEKTIMKELTTQFLDIISERRYNYRNERNFNPLKRMVQDKIDDILNENKDIIINGAINELANRLGRTKIVKSKVGELLEDVI